MTTVPEHTPPGGTVHGAFAARAAATPDATAVAFHGTRRGYADLDTTANQLAHHLRRVGVTPQSPVGVCLDRSPDLVVALLAVLKAGAYYVALEPTAPAARAGLILRDAGIRVVVTQRRLASLVDAAETLVVTEELPARTAGLPTTPPPDRPGPEDTAYVGYTSGSTGAPKGVAVPHRAVLRLVRCSGLLELAATDAMLHLSPVAFDASTLELWGPLVNGARVVVLPPGEVTSESVAATVAAEGVTALWLTAGLFHLMAEAPDERLRGLRLLIAGGDVLSVPHVNRMRAAFPGLRLMNGYGPTENTTFTCCHLVEGEVATRSVPIGRPVRGTSVHLLDADLRPVPDGEAGELYAGGLGVAHGYVGMPGHTAERFLPDPFAGVPGARMYRTGDLARRLPGDVFEFIGRADDQVKIRGFRVEPGEPEAVLLRLPRVRDCAVVVRDGETGRRLAAFFVADEKLPVPALRRELLRTLPPYLVPAGFTQLDALPLLPNGKVDRAGLAARRDRDRPALEVPFRAPGTELERWLARLWADLLELDEIGVDDEFFELGGHSLLATQLTSEISLAYGVTVTAQVFYENSTVAELATVVERLRTAAAGEAAQKGRRAG